MDAGHQVLDVDEPVAVAVALGFEKLAGHRKSTHALNEAVVAKVVDQQRRVRDECASESGTRHKDMTRPVRHGIRGEFRVTSGRRAGLASRLLAFPIPRFAVGRGIAYLLDTATGPPPLVFSLAAEEICGDSVVDDTIIHQEPVPVGGVCDSGGVHGGSVIGRPWKVNFGATKCWHD